VVLLLLLSVAGTAVVFPLSVEGTDEDTSALLTAAAVTLAEFTAVVLLGAMTSTKVASDDGCVWHDGVGRCAHSASGNLSPKKQPLSPALAQHRYANVVGRLQGRSHRALRYWPVPSGRRQ